MIGVYINMKPQQFQRMFFDRPNIAAIIEKRNARGLGRFGAYVMTRARRSMRQRKKISQPGQPPSAHLGLLRRGGIAVQFGYDVAKGSVVIGPLRGNRRSKTSDGYQTVPETLEYGGRRRMRRQSRIIKRRGGGKQKVVFDARSVRYKPRPYMRPAFDQEIDRVKNTLWFKTIGT